MAPVKGSYVGVVGVCGLRGHLIPSCRLRGAQGEGQGLRPPSRPSLGPSRCGFWGDRQEGPHSGGAGSRPAAFPRITPRWERPREAESATCHWVDGAACVLSPRTGKVGFCQCSLHGPPSEPAGLTLRRTRPPSRPGAHARGLMGRCLPRLLGRGVGGPPEQLVPSHVRVPSSGLHTPLMLRGFAPRFLSRS